MEELIFKQLIGKKVEITFNDVCLTNPMIRTEQGWLKKSEICPDFYKLECGFKIKRSGEPVIIRTFFIYPAHTFKLRRIK